MRVTCACCDRPAVAVTIEGELVCRQCGNGFRNQGYRVTTLVRPSLHARYGMALRCLARAEARLTRKLYKTSRAEYLRILRLRNAAGRLCCALAAQMSSEEWKRERPVVTGGGLPTQHWRFLPGSEVVR